MRTTIRVLPNLTSSKPEYSNVSSLDRSIPRSIVSRLLLGALVKVVLVAFNSHEKRRERSPSCPQQEVQAIVSYLNLRSDDYCIAEDFIPQCKVVANVQ